MRFIALLSLGVLVGGLFGGRVDGAVITQSQNFSDSQSSSGTGTIVHAGLAGLSVYFDPFNGSLGTLDSFSIAWTTTVVSGGTTGATVGNFQITMGGTYFVNSTSYDGSGGGDSLGGGPNMVLSPKTLTVSKTSTFLPSNAGGTYNSAILATLTGNVPFALTYQNPTIMNLITVNYNNMALINSSMTGSVTLTYNYTEAATVPEPASMWIGASLLSGVVGMRRFRRRA